MKTYREKFLSFFLRPATFKALQAVVIAISLLFLYQTYRKAFRDIGYDLTSYLLAGEAFLADANPYQTEAAFPFIYPLFLCVVIIPLTFLPYWLSVLLWFAANLAALFFSAKVLLRLYNKAIPSKKIILLYCFSFLLLYGIMNNNFLNGQINMLVLLLCTLFFHYYLNSRKMVAGWLLAAAIVTKLTPAIFVVYLFFKKDFRSLLLLIPQMAVLALLLPMLFTGSRVIGLYEHYFQTFILARLSGGAAEAAVSFDLTPVLQFLLPGLPPFISFCLAVALVLIPIVYTQLTIKQPGNSAHRHEVLIFSLYMLAMLLISPMSETHHLIYMYPAILLLLYSLAFGQNPNLKIWLILAVCMFAALAPGKHFAAGPFMAIMICYAFLYRRLWLLQQDNPLYRA